MTDPNAQHAEAIDALAPETRELTVTLDGKERKYVIRRLETRQIWPTLRAGLPIFEGLVGLVGIQAPSPAADSPLGGRSPPTGQSLDPPTQLQKLLGPEVAEFLELMAQHGERITEIVAIGLDEKVATVGRFEPQDLYFALRALVQVNADFFTRRVAPLLGLDPDGLKETALAGAVGQAMKSLGAGVTPSSSSSPQDTHPTT